MASQLTNLAIAMFAQNMKFISQQTYSKLFQTISPSNIEKVDGEEFSVEFMGSAADMVENTDPYGSSVETNTPMYRQWGITKPFIWGEMVSDVEVRRMGNADPKGKILKAASMARGRKVDDVILLALGSANSLRGKRLTGATSIPFPGTQQIDVDLGSADGLTPTGLNVEKLKAIQSLFIKNEVVETLKRYAVVSIKELQDLAAGVDIRSSDYKEIYNIINGKQTEWMGFNWILSNRLPEDTVNHIRTCYFYTEDALVWGDMQAYTVETDKRSDRRFNWYAQTTMDVGCLRGEDVQTVWVPCFDAAVV